MRCAWCVKSSQIQTIFQVFFLKLELLSLGWGYADCGGLAKAVARLLLLEILAAPAALELPAKSTEAELSRDVKTREFLFERIGSCVLVGQSRRLFDFNASGWQYIGLQK